MAAGLLALVSAALAVLAGVGVVAGIWWVARTTDAVGDPRSDAMRALAVTIFLVATAWTLV